MVPCVARGISLASVDLVQITKRFGSTPSLRGIGLRIEDGEFLSLVGPSGCGKSTLLRIIAGLEAQDTGQVRIGDVPVDGVRPGQRDVAMVFQSYALYPHLSAYDNMAAPLRMRRLRASQRLPLVGRFLPGRQALERQFRTEIELAAGMLGLDGVLHRRPGQLSGGQRQRVALGSAIVRHPAVFLMDEPLSNLDAQLRRHPRGARQPAPPPRRNIRLCHSRPGRSADHVGSRGGDDGRGSPAGRHASGDLSRSAGRLVHQPDVDQLPKAVSWVVFPGQNSVKIVRVIRDNVDRVLQQTATPDQALKDMAQQVRQLLPQH